MKINKSENEIDPAIKEKITNLENGTVLLATDVLQDPNFISSVVLICLYSKENGAYGLILNKPSHMPPCEICDSLSDIKDPREIFIGGPVQQDVIQVISISDTPIDNSYQLASNVYLGGKWQDVNEIFFLPKENHKIYLGYSGWAPGQLEKEIEWGAWDVYKVNIEKLLRNIPKISIKDTKKIASFLEEIKK
jgi:putative transcriptional regulator